MGDVHVCKYCGQTIMNMFNCCPWCGTKQDTAPKEVLDSVFESIQKMQQKDLSHKIAKMYSELEEITNDIQEFEKQAKEV